jgi:hypothetical protein
MDQAPPKSPSSYPPAAQDTEFLQREELRSIRIGLELLKPELQREQGVGRRSAINEPHMGSTYAV